MLIFNPLMFTFGYVYLLFFLTAFCVGYGPPGDEKYNLPSDLGKFQSKKVVKYFFDSSESLWFNSAGLFHGSGAYPVSGTLFGEYHSIFFLWMGSLFLLGKLVIREYEWFCPAAAKNHGE